MYCRYCGKQLADDAAYCPHCGTPTGERAKRDEFFDSVPPYTRPAAPTKKMNTLAIVGFVLSFFVSLAGLICSIIARKQCNETGEDGAGLALAGIIISAVSMGLAFILGIIWGSLLGSLWVDSLLLSFSVL